MPIRPISYGAGFAAGAPGPAQQAYYSPQPSMSGPPTPGAYQTNGFAQPFAAPLANPQAGYQPQAFAQPPARQRRPRVGRIVLAALLLLLLVGALAGGAYVFLTNQNQGATTSAPASPRVAPTALPKGTPSFKDAFTSNKNGWDATSASGLYAARVGNGSLVLEDDNKRLLWELVPGGKNFKDFFLTVDASLSRGAQDNGYGIYIRGASSQSLDIATYYRFELYGDGTYAIFIGKVNASGVSQSSLLAKYAFSPAIHKQGALNHIAISARGASMSLLVNGEVLQTVTDNTYTAGSVALFVSNLTPPLAQATFSKLVIYPPQTA